MTTGKDGLGRRRALATAAGGLLGAGAAAIALAAVTAAGADPDDSYRQLARFGAVLALIEEKYVDRPDEARLIDAALKAMVASLDPHSGYVSGRAYRKFESFARGEIAGVGLTLVARGKGPAVARVMDGKSAARAGVLPGDRIVAIDGETTEGFTVARTLEKTRGAADSPVRLTVGRGATVRDVEVLRDCVETRSVEFRVESGDVGYIRIPQFIDSTAREVRSAMASLGAEVPPGVFKGYVLDLRNDPGGLVNQAVETVNAFVDGGTIVSTRGRAAGADQIFTARPGENLSQGRPLAVLINGGSASAAEIVAGALQDLKRATLIGARTFGKGSMQSTIPLGDGALHFTPALYFLPSGRSLQARGIDPDIEVPESGPAGAKAPGAGLGEASIKGHLKNPLGDRPASSAYIPPDPADDGQLSAAIDFLHGLAHARRE